MPETSAMSNYNDIPIRYRIMIILMLETIVKQSKLDAPTLYRLMTIGVCTFMLFLVVYTVTNGSFFLPRLL